MRDVPIVRTDGILIPRIHSLIRTVLTAMTHLTLRTTITATTSARVSNAGTRMDTMAETQYGYYSNGKAAILDPYLGGILTFAIN